VSTAPLQRPYDGWRCGVSLVPCLSC
jgi:hypothetical protein